MCIHIYYVAQIVFSTIYMHAIFSLEFVIFVAFPSFLSPSSLSRCLPILLLGRPQPGLHSSYIYDFSYFSYVPLFIYNRTHIGRGVCVCIGALSLYMCVFPRYCMCVCLSNERACNNCELCRLVHTHTRLKFIRKITNAFE